MMMNRIWGWGPILVALMIMALAGCDCDSSSDGARAERTVVLRVEGMKKSKSGAL